MKKTMKFCATILLALGCLAGVGCNNQGKTASADPTIPRATALAPEIRSSDSEEREKTQPRKTHPKKENCPDGNCPEKKDCSDGNCPETENCPDKENCPDGNCPDKKDCSDGNCPEKDKTPHGKRLPKPRKPRAPQENLDEPPVHRFPEFPMPLPVFPDPEG